MSSSIPSVSTLTIFLRVISITLAVTFSVTLQSAVLDFVEAEATDGGLHDIVISPDGDFVYAYELHPQDGARINIYSRSVTRGELAFISNTASVSADQLDTVTDNDSDSEETLVSISGGSGATSPPATSDTSGSDGDGGGGSSNPLTLLLLSALWVLFRNRLSLE
ncbi:MAG: hypothetical protein AAES65_08980 [Candidatus Thiodiazotropha sp. (ex. Lucinoma kazani)]